MFAVVYAVVLAAATPSCSVAEDALRAAQKSWGAFKNGDFVDRAAEAEAQFRAAKRDLAAADKATASCRSDRTALSRIRLHFEFDLVDARRSSGSNESLARVRSDLQSLQKLSTSETARAAYVSDLSRFRELQAETRGRIVMPAYGAPQPSAACTVPDAQAHPLAPIAPAVPDAQLLRRPHGVTAISVLVSAQGEVLGTLTIASSGEPLLDQAVSNAARLVAYAPARVNCAAVEGEYRFTYSFPQF